MDDDPRADLIYTFALCRHLPALARVTSDDTKSWLHLAATDDYYWNPPLEELAKLYRVMHRKPFRKAQPMPQRIYHTSTGRPPPLCGARSVRMPQVGGERNQTTLGTSIK
jgi:hypothetical protein